MTAIIIFFDITILRRRPRCGFYAHVAESVPSQFCERRLGAIRQSPRFIAAGKWDRKLVSGLHSELVSRTCATDVLVPSLLRKSNAATVSSHLPLPQTDCARSRIGSMSASDQNPPF
jgi:hypothetical protein